VVPVLYAVFFRVRPGDKAKTSPPAPAASAVA